MNQDAAMDAKTESGHGGCCTAPNSDWPAMQRKRDAAIGIVGSSQIPLEADRVLHIWAWYKRQEGGAVTLGYPRHSAGFTSGGASTEDSFEEMVEAADRRTGAIADAILDEMSLHGHARQVMAIWNRYLGDVARFRGDHGVILIDGCRAFLVEAKKRGIAV